MSIFKQTLSQTIQDQLKARTNVVSGVNNNRNTLLPWYLSKNSWVRMTSMVNYDSGKVKFDGTGQITVDKDEIYNNTELAKKNILEGGQLYVKSNANGQDIASLRKNIASLDGAYGGNFDLRGNGTSDPQYRRQFGIRPMPGITSVNLHTVSAYGSLFETTVNFYAWDNHQLNELEILFMRPGYSVLLEWGWSQYIDNNNQPTVFNGLTTPAFINSTQQEIYDKIEALRIKNDHNYDGMLGYVKNFSWKMMKNGGYECSTTLISMGEVINSLKISTNNLKINNDPKPTFDFTSKDNYVYDDFENIFISLKSTGEGYLKESNTLGEEEYRGKWNHDKNYISRNRIENKLKLKGYNILADKLAKQPFVKKIKSGDKSPEGQYYEYISLDVLVAIIDVYFNLQITSNKKPTLSDISDTMVKIIPPSEEDYCLASKDSISVDPSVCLVSNPIAFKEEFLKGLNPIYEKNKGVATPVQSVTLVDGKYHRSDELVLLGGQFYDDDQKVGKIGNIFVNLNLILQEYKNIKNSANDEGVNLTVYFKNILNKISNALGGLNNFSLSTAGRDQNTLRIIDLYYLEQDDSKNKYEFDLIGLNSIVRDATVESQIFENQSTIVAIAAQSRANLGDLYNSTQVYLNAGITDRVALAKAPPEENTFENLGDKNDVFYSKLFEFLLYVRDNVVGANPADDYAISTNTSGTVPYTFLKQFMLKYNGELNFKALLPFKLNIKLDGIGGIVIGEIFKVKKDILPKNYADKNLGFVITKISHDLQNNDWETTLETQICLLDNITLGKDFINVTRKGFGEYTTELKLYGLIYTIAHQFVRYQAYRSMIGFMWLSNNDKTIKEGFDYLGFDFFKILGEVGSNIEPLDNKTEIDEIWRPNVGSMLLGIQQNDLSPVNITNSVSWFSIYQFRQYVEEWIIAYKNKYNTELSNIVIGNTTLLDSLNLFEAELNDEQSPFNSTIDTISNFVTTNYENVYIPDDPKNNKLTILPYNNYPLFLDLGSNFTTTGKVTLGIDVNKLDNNILNYFNNSTELSDLKNQYINLISKLPLAKGTAIQDDPLLYVIPPKVNAVISIRSVIVNLQVNKTIYNEFLRTINYANASNSSLTIKNEYKDLLRGKTLEFV